MGRCPHCGSHSLEVTAVEITGWKKRIPVWLMNTYYLVRYLNA